MKKINKLLMMALTSCCLFSMTSCGDDGEAVDKDLEVEIVKDDAETHYLKFIEGSTEILRIVVLEGETYSDLCPYFPTLDEEEGFIKYWDGDFNYTDYSLENQFTVYSETNLIIDIYSYLQRF